MTLSILICGLFRGHTIVKQFADNRIYQRCLTCPLETPGWICDRPSPVITHKGDNNRHRLPTPERASEYLWPCVPTATSRSG